MLLDLLLDTRFRPLPPRRVGVRLVMWAKDYRYISKTTGTITGRRAVSALMTRAAVWRVAC